MIRIENIICAAVFVIAMALAIGLTFDKAPW
jgi:hypothetical protein